ncbi:helix-turn-helix domain-containing protein [Bacillus albus]|uniref:helix-turn-helix domain-containing protein n=1 Tax=Bacillus albus TaxID=2026189 RepID=UPI00102299EF|nr:helix-turn-helix domain-containing protein [Bacillus albus]
MNKLTMSAKDVADLLGVCCVTIYRMCRQKKIPHNKIGARYIFNRVTIERWLEENEVSPIEAM